MALRFREDRYLKELANWSNDELDVLVRMLTHDKDGSRRMTEELTSDEKYKRYYPDHKKYWDRIAAEYQLFGGNTFANIARGKGVVYEEILRDVAKDMKIKFDKNESVENIEKKLIAEVLGEMFEKLDPKDQEEFLKIINYPSGNVNKQAVAAATLAAMNMGGFLTYQLAVIVANMIAKALVGRGLAFAANAALTQGLAVVTGPIGWAVLGAWTALDIAGPAKRVTIPVTIYIATMRQAKRFEKQKEMQFTTAVCPDCFRQVELSDAVCKNCGRSLA